MRPARRRATDAAGARCAPLRGVVRAAALKVGSVAQRRQGTWVHYRLAPQDDADCDRQLRGLAAAFTPREALRRDVERLLEGSGPAGRRARRCRLPKR